MSIKTALTFVEFFTIEKRTSDYMAYLNGDRRFWGCGKTEDEAVGSAVRAHVRNVLVDQVA